MIFLTAHPHCAHSAPLRAIVPGHVGVRNAKWLNGIVLSDEEAPGPWQRGMAYKVRTGVECVRAKPQRHL